MGYDGELKFDTRIDKTGFKVGIGELGSIAQSGMKAVTTAVTAAGTALTALGGYAVSVGKDFESSMSQVIATMGITKDSIVDGVNSYDLLKEAASKAGAETVFSASEAADALNYLALAGYSAVQAADALPAVLNLAAAGGLDLAYASDLATDAMAALGIEATSENLTRFGDELAKTASTANANVAQLGEAILTVGGTAKSLAGGTTELNAALGVLANRGIKGSEGGTALRNMILALTAPTDKAAQSIENLGLAVYDAEGNMRPLNEIFKDLDASLAGMSEGEKTAVLNEIFNKVDLKSAQAMLAGCGEEFDNLTAALEGCDGAMAQMAETMNDNLQGDLKSIQSRAEAFGIAIYEGIQEPLRNVVQLGIDYISQLTDAYSSGGFDGLASALGDVLGDAISRVAEFAPRFFELGANIIDSLISGLIRNKSSIVDAARTVITGLIQSFAELYPEIISAGIEMITQLAVGMTESADELVNSVIDGIELVLDSITENLPDFIDAAVQIISSLVMGITNSLPMLINAAVTIITTICTQLFSSDNISNLISAAIQIITLIADTIKNNLSFIISTAIAIIEMLVGQLLTPENIELLMSAALDILMSIVDAIIDNLDELIAVALNIIIFLCTELLKAENLQKLLDAGLKILLAVVDAIVDNIDEVLIAATTIITTLAEELLKPENLEKIISTGVELLAQLIVGLCQLAGKFVGFAGELFSELKTALSEIDWAELGISIVEGICSGLLDIDFKLDEYIGEFKDNWVTGFKDAFDINSPSRLMKEYVGKPIAQGVGAGFVENIPDVEDSAVAAFDHLARNVSNYSFIPNIDTGNIINNSTDDHSTGDTTINEENHYHIYTQAKNASDMREIAEGIEFIKSQDRNGKGLKR